MTNALNIGLSCTFDATPTMLRVAYTVNNPGPGEVGLFNRIDTVNLDGTLNFAPDNVYVEFEAGTLHLRKMTLPLPEGLDMAGRPVPYVTRLPAGQSFREEVRLSVPVEVRHPFRRAILAAEEPEGEVVAAKPVEASRVTFSLGVFAVTPDLAFHRDFLARPDVLRVWPPGPPVDRQVVLTREAQLSPTLPVLDYES